MKKKLKVIVLVIILLLLLGCLVLSQPTTIKETTLPETIQIGATQPKSASFEWAYSSFEKDQMPWTDVILVAKYSDGTKETKHVETIEGNCNEYTERDTDVYEASQMIICYYAGFGRYYKVVKKETGYEVQRKEFEEASPDYSPPVQNFQTIMKF